MLIYQTRLYCQKDNSDKVYIVHVDQTKPNEFVVSTSWGKRVAKHLNTQIKVVTQTRNSAINQAEALVRAKTSSAGDYKLAPSSLDIPGAKALGLVSDIIVSNTVAINVETSPGKARGFRNIKI